MIANTASRAGVTTPPGDTAYNVSKAAVRVLTESLQHRLRSMDVNTDGQMMACLLLPGTTNTNILYDTTARLKGPDAASAQQVYPNKNKRKCNCKIKCIRVFLFHILIWAAVRTLRRQLKRRGSPRWEQMR